MIIIAYENLRLELISTDDLEMIRLWRNTKHVQDNMEYKSIISTEHQKNWFCSLDQHQNLYFKILTSDTPIGVVNLKNIDWSLREAEAGIFIGREDFLGTITPVIAVFVLMKIAFDGFGLEKLYAKIWNKNEVALKFNNELGYQFFKKMSDEFDQYLCNKDSFYQSSSSIVKIHDLFYKNGTIQVYINKESEWIIDYLKVEESNNQIHLFLE